MAYRLGMSENTAHRKEKFSGPASGRPRVLLADDDRAVRALALHHFRDAPWEADAAVDGAEAVALFESRSYAVVLLDLEMPPEGGTGAARAMRAAERLRGRSAACLLAFSAHAGEPEFTLPEGFDGAVAKPFTREGLLHAVARRLEHGAQDAPGTGAAAVGDAGAKTSAMPSEIGSDGPAGGGAAPAAPAKESGTDAALVHLMPKVADSLADLGAEAGAALESGDFAALGRAGHTMLGTASCFGLPGAMGVARDLEQAAMDKNAAQAAAALERLPGVLGALVES